MFMDEARFGRISDARRCWAPYGVRPSVSAQVIREFIYAYAAVSPSDGHLDALVLPEVNADSMSLFLQEVSENHKDDHVIMIMDRAGWHTAKGVHIPDNITLHWLPAYSPELNPVEHIWDEIREKWFHNRVFLSLDAVEDQLVISLAYLIHTPDLVKSLTLFRWLHN